jgi:hypothetical protein
MRVKDAREVDEEHVMTARDLGAASESEEAPASGMATPAEACVAAAPAQGMLEMHPVSLHAPPVETAEEHTNKWAVLALAGVAAFMTTLDSSIVNIGLPSIARSFGVAATGAVEWVIIGYLVVTAALLLTFGRLADMLGRKPLFLAGLVLFTLWGRRCARRRRRWAFSSRHAASRGWVPR